jgi:hypothetical protein
MVSSGMLRRVALVRADVSEEPIASFIRVTRIGELGTKLAVTSNRLALRVSVTSYSILLQRLCPRILPKMNWLLNHENAVFRQEILTQNKMTGVPRSCYSSDLALCDSSVSDMLTQLR